ncbi:MAG: fatty acid desaturase, partial [Myxococcales bacterium]|nr:fatty acid desaturase [Myxococcales bacterium]
WTAIDGEVYDITEFAARHPGGGIIRLAAGREADLLLESYHSSDGLRRAHRLLRRVPRVGALRPEDRAPRGDPAFFETVRARVEAHLRDRGLSRHHGARARALELLALTLALALCWCLRALTGSYLAAIACGLLIARLGFLQHSGNHAAAGATRAANRRAGLLMDALGGSSRVWSVEHQLAHHLHPNVLRRDNDCEIASPLLRLHPGLPRRFWHRGQHVTTFALMSVGLLKWLVSDLVDHLRGRVGNAPFHASARDWALVLACKSTWLIIHVLVPAALLGWPAALATTVVMMASAAYYLESIFIVNHIQPGLVPPARAHWAVVQVRATANWSSGSRLANALSGGLNHQIEHHLFPGLAIALYPEISPIVRRTCEEFGLPYNDFPGFFAAWRSTFAYLRELGLPPRRASTTR